MNDYKGFQILFRNGYYNPYYIVWTDSEGRPRTMGCADEDGFVGNWEVAPSNLKILKGQVYDCVREATAALREMMAD